MKGRELEGDVGAVLCLGCSWIIIHLFLDYEKSAVQLREKCEYRPKKIYELSSTCHYRSLVSHTGTYSDPILRATKVVRS